MTTEANTHIHAIEPLVIINVELDALNEEAAGNAASKPLVGEILPPADEKLVTKTIESNSKPLTEGKIRQIADRIRLRNRRVIEGIVENGHDLTQVKRSLPHGKFLPWLTREFGWSERTAQNYMNAAQNFDELVSLSCNPDTIMLVAPTALYTLGKLSEKDKADFVSSIKSGSIAKARSATARTSKISKKPSTSALFSKDHADAEKLAKEITSALPLPVRTKLHGLPGFNDLKFGEFLKAEIARSFGASSEKEAA